MHRLQKLNDVYMYVCMYVCMYIYIYFYLFIYLCIFLFVYKILQHRICHIYIYIIYPCLVCNERVSE